MSKVEEVSKFIKNIFYLYDMNDYGFFVDTRNKEPYDIVSVDLFKNGKIEGSILSRVSLHTGFTKEELMSLDRNVARKYLRKFPFFKHLIDYKIALEGDQKHAASPDEQLLQKNISQSTEEVYVSCPRYNEEDIRERLITQLKEIDQYVPGTWHASAELLDIHWYTDTLIGYSDCPKLLKTYLETVDYYKYLFFKSLKTDLKGTEASDFNFLTSALRVMDIISPLVDINTDTMRNLRRIYNEEGYKDLMSYVRFNVFNEIEPWRCMSFLDDWKLAQGYINTHRDGKKSFVEFARNVGKILCYYSWSDDLEKADVDYDIFDEGRKNYIQEELYLDKTPEEIKGWEDALDRLMNASASETKGGLKRPKREFSPYLMPQSVKMEKAFQRKNAERGIFTGTTNADNFIQMLKGIDEKNRRQFPNQYDVNGMRIPLPDEDIGIELTSAVNQNTDPQKGGEDNE